MSKKPEKDITVDGEPHKLILKKDKIGEPIWWKRAPKTKDNKIRKGSHFIHGKPDEHHYDIYLGNKDTGRDDDKLANKGPAITILDLKQKEIFLADRCDEAERVFTRFLINNPRVAMEILKRILKNKLTKL